RTAASPLLRRFDPVNAAILLMGSAWMAGADTAQPPAAAAPAPAYAPGPVAVNTGAGCGGCGPTAGGCCDDPCAKHGLLHRLKNRGGGGGLFAKHKHNDCGCAPAPAPCCAAPAPVYTAPVYTGFTTACCD